MYKAQTAKCESVKSVLPIFDALVREELPHPGARNFVTKN